MTTVTTYPSAVDYTLALQNPGSAFVDAGLKTATFTQSLMGPYGIAGSSAVVFHATVAGEDYALRCYTRQDASTPERYAALDSFVSDNRLTKSCGIVTWYKEQIQVKGARWPVLKMGWIAGQQLNEYAGYLADTGNGAALGTLAHRWLTLVDELQRAGFAHGDLQHGNIMVDQQGQLRLVDFDSVWIPPLQGQVAPNEIGHPSYQPRTGTAQSRWGPYMDTFSALVIYLALIALAKDPGLWARFNNGDNLLFERDDFAPSLDSEIWRNLAAVGDPEVDKVTAKLKDCCADGWVASRTLEDTLRTTWWQQITPAPTPLKTTPPTPAPAPAAGAPPTGPMWVASATGGVTVPGQPGPSAGSLPPPPATPYHSTVAPQSPGTPPGGTPRPGDRAWWGPGQAKPEPAPAEPAAAAAAAQAAGAPAPSPAPARQPARSGGGRAVAGGLLMVAAIITFVVLAAHNLLVEGVIWGVLLFLGGAVVAESKPKRPPGN